jgi:hypothetical protein
LLLPFAGVVDRGDPGGLSSKLRALDLGESWALAAEVPPSVSAVAVAKHVDRRLVDAVDRRFVRDVDRRFVDVVIEG